MIDREDMLELTRRMTLSRNCFDRIAGAYMDQEGYADGTFNVNFRGLSKQEQTKYLAIAKKIPFSKTNKQLVEGTFTDEARKPGGIWRLLLALQECDLKDDALLEVLYEIIGEWYEASGNYVINVFHGNYDVPRKGSDKASQWESEQVYRFMICTISPQIGEYEPGEPEWGFMFPAFVNRAVSITQIGIFNENPDKPDRKMEKLLGVAIK